eukprot:4235040-Pyramimonas_sp.AAC.1
MRACLRSRPRGLCVTLCGCFLIDNIVERATIGVLLARPAVSKRKLNQGHCTITEALHEARREPHYI